MRFLTLYLRSRRVPVALAVSVGGTLLVWTLWTLSSGDPSAAPSVVVLTVLLLVAAVTHTLGGPEGELHRTAALRWPWRRAVHLIAALAVAAALPALVLGLHGMALRDAAGLLGLTALGAAVAGVARAWFLPLAWTLPTVIFGPPGPLLGQVLTWQTQAPGSRAAAVVAVVLAVGGTVAYAVAGPRTSASVSSS